jgi:hypothetical protein
MRGMPGLGATESVILHTVPARPATSACARPPDAPEAASPRQHQAQKLRTVSAYGLLLVGA